MTGDVRYIGGPFQPTLVVDDAYVGGRPSFADEAVISLYKRAGIWNVLCTAGWRVTETGDELFLRGSDIQKAITADATQKSGDHGLRITTRRSG